jgi:radical SAM superfamily enzyme with C-terminal helix-hairpin-helix motif
MFQRFAPLGTLLPGIFLESRSGHCIFGRALGSYPPLVGIMDDALPENTEVTVAVTDYGKRSLTGVPFPLSLATCSRTNLLALPGIGKARADRIFHNFQRGKNSSLEELLDDSALAAQISMYFTEGKTL